MPGHGQHLACYSDIFINNGLISAAHKYKKMSVGVECKWF